jgi:hypothetical protein
MQTHGQQHGERQKHSKKDVDPSYAHRQLRLRARIKDTGLAGRR